MKRNKMKMKKMILIIIRFLFLTLMIVKMKNLIKIQTHLLNITNKITIIIIATMMKGIVMKDFMMNFMGN